MLKLPERLFKLSLIKRLIKFKVCNYKFGSGCSESYAN